MTPHRLVFKIINDNGFDIVSHRLAGSGHHFMVVRSKTDPVKTGTLTVATSPRGNRMWQHIRRDLKRINQKELL
jgi:hypothetical protein